MDEWNESDPDFEDYVEDPNRPPTSFELEEQADEILRAHAKEIDPKTGKERGIGGKDPILFKEHIYARMRREIFPESGTPDPNLVAGMYNRTHPQGRKVNSNDARKKHGASFYKG